MNGAAGGRGMEFRVRRGTLEDLAQLASLWKTMGFDPEHLSRHITDFQVAVGPDGSIAGAVGLSVAERQGRVHSEAFVDFAHADAVRPQLWQRLQMLANNFGLLRLWTREEAPFWHHCGLTRATAEELKLLPAPWLDNSAKWLTLKLREDIDAMLAADRDFTRYMEVEKAKTSRRAKMLKTTATLIAAVVIFLILGAAVYLMIRHPYWRRH